MISSALRNGKLRSPATKLFRVYHLRTGLPQLANAPDTTIIMSVAATLNGGRGRMLRVLREHLQQNLAAILPAAATADVLLPETPVTTCRGLADAAATWQIQHTANAWAAPADAPYPIEAERCVSVAAMQQARAQLETWPEYSVTPLYEHAELADMLGVSSVSVKDESVRVPAVGSFKALGGALAVEDVARLDPAGAASVTVTTASAGNHGLAVAWGATRAGASSRVYIASHVSEAMADRIRGNGAEVVRVEGSYEDSIAACIEESEQNGWEVIQDVAWEGYEAVPQRINAGYAVLAAEICEQSEGDLTHIFVNTGVGGFASAVFGLVWDHYASLGKPRPKFITVEPTQAACAMHCLREGAVSPAPKPSGPGTVQTGLDCLELTPLAWPVFLPGVTDCVTVPDDAVGPTVEMLAAGSDGIGPIIAGESGVASVATLLAAAAQPELKAALQLTAESRVAVVICEGSVSAA